MFEESKVLTVKELSELCNKLIASGYGDLPVKCQDAIIHNDEVSIMLHPKGHMLFRGYLFNQDFARKISEFETGFKKLTNRFYGYIDEYEENHDEE